MDREGFRDALEGCSLIISVICGRVVAGDNISREILRNLICPVFVGWLVFFFCLSDN